MKHRTDYSKKYNTEESDKIIEDVSSFEEEDESVDPIYVRVKVDKLNLRPYPSTDNNPVNILSKNAELMILENLDIWYKVMTASGSEGYVLKEYVS